MPEDEEVFEPGGDEEGGQQADPPEDTGAWRPGLPDEWKGKTEQEIATLWGSAASVLSAKNDEVETLKRTLAERDTVVNDPPPPPPEEEPIDFRSMIFDDPEKAIDAYLNKKYGTRFTDLERSRSDLALMKVEKEFSDFDEHRDTIEQIVSRKPGGPATEHDVRAAYLMAKGLSVLEAEKEAARQIHNEPPSPPKPPEKKVEATELEAEVSKAMGFESIDEFVKWRDSDDEMTVEVPRGDF